MDTSKFMLTPQSIFKEADIDLSRTSKLEDLTMDNFSAAQDQQDFANMLSFSPSGRNENIIRGKYAT